jgi:NAD(P)-dependent dehydrogenase (short-subunit alcohol dehydrogenase family)
MFDSFNANVVGVMKTISAFLPLIKAGSAKKIIVISSVMADPDLVRTFEVTYAAPYSISKAAVNLLVAKYHAAYTKEGILFIAISPGLVDTGTGGARKCCLTSVGGSCTMRS